MLLLDNEKGNLRIGPLFTPTFGSKTQPLLQERENDHERVRKVSSITVKVLGLSRERDREKSLKGSYDYVF